jgi:hypothetical protein
MSTDVSEAIAAMIAERAQARQAAFEAGERNRTALEEIKAGFKRRRTYGLQRRHAAKLARLRTAPDPIR